MLTKRSQTYTYRAMTFFVVMIASLFSCESSDLDDFVLPPDALELKTLLLEPIQDAYLQDEQGYNRTIIRVEQDKRTSYLKFDLRPVDGVIEDVRLTLTVDSDEGDGILKIYKAENVQWSEANLSAANAPASTDLLSEANRKYRLGESTSFRLNRYYLNSEMTTIKLEHNEGNDMAFASRENPNSTGPKLEVKYWVPADTPDSDTTEDESEASEDDPAGDESGSEESGNSDGGSDSESGDSSEGGSSDGSGDSGSSGGDDGGSTGGSSDGSGDSGSSGGDDNGSSGGSDSGSGDSGSTGGDDSGSTGGSDSGSGDSSDSGSTGGNDSGSTGGGTGGSDSGSTGGDSSGSGTSGGSAPEGSYIVTPQGSWNADGKTEATAWSIERALEMAVAGDVVYIKAGNYGDRELEVENSGSANNPIRFIGYTNSPGDVVSENGSTYAYGDSLDSSKLPLISTPSNADRIGLLIQENHILFENIQIRGFRKGVQVRGNNVHLKNIIVTESGNQNVFDAYDGKGIWIRGDNALLENCFVLNATAESITLSDSNFSRVNHCAVYADNNGNPTDYYFLLTGGTNNTVVENSVANRARGLDHNGHGFDMKDLAENNVFRNCTSIRTSIELNFAGVKNNLIEDCKIIGVNSQTNEWHARILIANGANNNLIRRIDIQDTWAAIVLNDYDDGYVGPGGDRDLESLGFSNQFEDISITNTERMLNIGGGKVLTVRAKDYSFTNCTVNNFNNVAVVYKAAENFTFTNCTFTNGNNLYILAKQQFEPYSRFDVIWENCTWTDVGFTPPS